jgi:hypothetical protein
MPASTAQEKHDTDREVSQPSNLDDRYGKIGIPAVAAAVRCRAKERKSDRLHLIPQDCD